MVAGVESNVNWPTPVVPEPETLSTFKNVPAVIFPVGNFIVYDWLAECGGLCRIIPWLLASQLSWIAPGFVAPNISILPVPFGPIFKSTLESPPVAWIDGALLVAAFVMSIWFTADAVVWNTICSFPFSSLIPCASSKAMLCELVSKSPPSCGVVSSTMFEIPKAIVSILGLVESLAVANTMASPLSVAEKVKESPEPVAYLNWTVYAPDVEFLKK